MANFDQTTRDKISSVHQASRIQQIIFSVYAQAKAAQAMLTLYLGGTDPVFNAAINAMLTTGERTELGQMLSQINGLCQDWEANHASVIAEG